jgi:excisionase family DNA binding protein
MYSCKEEKKRILDEYIDILGAGRRLKIHPDTVRRLTKERKIPPFKFANKWLIDKKDLERLAQSHARRTKAKEQSDTSQYSDKVK